MNVTEIEITQEDIDSAVNYIKTDFIPLSGKYCQNCIVGRALNRQYSVENSLWKVIPNGFYLYSEGNIDFEQMFGNEELIDLIRRFDEWVDVRKINPNAKDIDLRPGIYSVSP